MSFPAPAALLPDGLPAPSYPSEPLTLIFSSAYFTLHTPVPFAGHGTIYLTPARLILRLHPLPAGAPAALALPLAAVRPSSLALRRPFLCAPRVVGAACGAEFALEPACGERDDRVVALFDAVRGAVGDEDAARAAARRAQDEADRALVATEEHTAFFDPRRPERLLLAAHLAAPGGR
jgi:hypothetical protein